MTQTEEFSVLVQDQEYHCKRIVITDNVATQEIFVTDIGRKEDSHPYEPNQIDSMPAAARRIAKEIIEENRRIEE